MKPQATRHADDLDPWLCHMIFLQAGHWSDE